MKKSIVLAILAILLPITAYALVVSHYNGCNTITLCNAVTADGDCGYVAGIGDGKYTHHIYSDASTSSAYTGTVCMSNDGSTTTCNELSPTITVTNTATQNYWDGALKYYWVKISGHTAGGTPGVTIYDYTCPLAN